MRRCPRRHRAGARNGGRSAKTGGDVRVLLIGVERQNITSYMSSTESDCSCFFACLRSLKTTSWYSLLSLLIIGAASAIGQSAAGTGVVNEWHRRPVQAVPSPQSGTARQLWSIRGSSFDRDGGASYALDNPIAANANKAAHPGAGSVEDRYFLTNPLPSKDSDAIVLATFTNYVVEMSPSKRSLYTVLHFSVEDVLKSTNPDLLSSAVIDSLVAGGSLDLDGKTVRYRTTAGDDTPLEEHQRYLLFLKYNARSENYSIIKHWKLDNGEAVAVDLFERQRAMKGTSEFDGRPENNLIDATKEAIRSERRSDEGK